jgi:hypothetical protein
MIKKIRKYLGLCDHKWKIINISDVQHISDFGSKPLTYYHQQCEHCGKIKHVKVNGHYFD